VTGAFDPLYGEVYGLLDALLADPAWVPVSVSRGDLFLRLGDRAAALRSFEAALRVAPFHPVARRRVAELRGGWGIRGRAVRSAGQTTP